MTYYVSPSRLKQYQDCPRAWAFRAIGGLPDVRTAALDYGVRAHALAEARLRGEPIDLTTPEGRDVIEGAPYLPQPCTPMLIEPPMTFEFGGVWWTGRLDLVAPGWKIDHKFVSSDRYIFTSETLVLDPAALLYTLAEPRFDPTSLLWLYYIKGKKRCIPVRASLTIAEAESRVREQLVPIGREMTALKIACRNAPDPLRLVQLIPPNPANCFRYNRMCPYAGHCDQKEMKMANGAGPSNSAILEEIQRQLQLQLQQQGQPAVAPQPPAPPPVQLPPAPAQPPVGVPCPPQFPPAQWAQLSPEQQQAALAYLNQAANAAAPAINPPPPAAASLATPPTAAAPEAKRRGRPTKEETAAKRAAAAATVPAVAAGAIDLDALADAIIDRLVARISG
ncbi:MAG: PD-(D/E)XK nuclease family protein [bacterium]